MLQKIIIFLFCIQTFNVRAQVPERVATYNTKINTAKTEEEKIEALINLADYYSIFNFESKADSMMQKAMLVAEMSSNKELLFKVLFNNNITNIKSWSKKETFERSALFIKKGLTYAQELNKPDYIAISHIRLAGIYRKRGQFNEALEQVTHAFTVLSNVSADSLKSVLHNELGDIYVTKGDAISGYKNYNTAFAIAYKLKNFPLQSEIYRRFADFYLSFGEKETAKKYLLQSLQNNMAQNYIAGQYQNLYDLGRITDDSIYITKAILLAADLKSDRYLMNAKKLLFYWYMVNGKNSTNTFNFLLENPELDNYFNNSGNAFYNWQLGNIYYYSDKLDSAIYYFKKAESELITNYDPVVKLSVTNSMAEAYYKNKAYTTAKQYYEKAYFLNKEIGQTSTLPVISVQLGKLFAMAGDYKNAYFYIEQADSANVLLQTKSAKDKVLLLQIDRENSKRENDLEEARHQTERKHNLQIMAIVLTLTIVFAIMLFVGMFAVSKTTIRMIGYFAFISLFEFIIVLLDHPILEITHGEPMKIWGIKIGVIALLVPIQQFLEHRLIHFLQSRKLLEARQRFSFKNWWYRLTKKPLPSAEESGKEEDTNQVKDSL